MWAASLEGPRKALRISLSQLPRGSLSRGFAWQRTPWVLSLPCQALHGIFPVHASVPDIYPCNRDTGHIGLTATRITSFSFADFSEAYLIQVTVRAPGN